MSDRNDLSIVQVGAGGYGRMYLDLMAEHGAGRGLRYAGIVEPYPDGGERLEALRAQGVPLYATLEDFYAENAADIAIISSPIQHHKPQGLLAFSRGSHVLCEKPLAANVEDCRDLIDARDAAGRVGEVGFQWSFTRTIRAMKADIRAGRYGAPVLLKSLLFWPRDAAYYARGSGWAGRVRDRYGKLVNDSVASNATAHYLHNMLFVLGYEPDRSLTPEAVRALLLRANPIENFDTCFLEAQMPDTEARVLFFATHAVHKRDEDFLRCEYRFERGVIRYEGRQFVGHLDDGTSIEYGNPDRDPDNKLFAIADEIRQGRGATCSFEAGLSHIQCIVAAQESMDVRDFPPDIVATEDGFTYARGLRAVAERCYAEDRVPTGADAPWGETGGWIGIM